MSHHLDSPIARQDIRRDTTDLYFFRGEVGTVLVINVCHSIAGAVPNPGFHPEGMYEFKVDLDRDAVEEITYRIKARRRRPAADDRPSDRRHTRDGSPCAGYVGGGMVKSHRACGSLTPHRCYGIEARVIDIISG